MLILNTILLVCVIFSGGYIFNIHRRLEMYRQNNIYLHYLLKYVPLGFYFKNLDGTIVLANKEFADMVDTDFSSIVGKNYKEVFIKNIHPIIEAEDKEIIKTKSIINLEKTFTLKKNEPHHFRILKSPITDINNNVKGFIVIFKNIDDVKEIENNKETFIATLTHDLKTPTFAQINMSKLLLNEHFGKLTKEQAEMITLIQDSCSYCADLIATVLYTYKYNTGQIKLNISDFDIIELINILKNGLKNLSKERNIEIRLNTNYEKYIINADKLQIKRVIVNLLSNAITYSYEKTTINIDFEVNKNTITVRIKNSGTTISKQELKTIFEQYTLENCYAKQTSTGLGLYLSKQIIESHNGEIKATSLTDEEINIFEFTIPTTYVKKQIL